MDEIRIRKVFSSGMILKLHEYLVTDMGRPYSQRYSGCTFQAIEKVVFTKDRKGLSFVCHDA